MKKYLITTCIILIHNIVFAQVSKFQNAPWLNPVFPIIIDPYQGNKIGFEKLITDKRVAGIIHKASQGFKKDNMFLLRKDIASQKGLLFASYHLGTNEDPIKQADYYLSILNKDFNDPMALDIEDFQKNKENKPYMPLENAIKFINRVYQKTNKFPILYINNKVFNEINSKYNKSSVFAKCPLWYARFLTKLPDLNNKIWEKVNIWQFSSEINCKADGNCLYNVPGTSHDIDINVFNGSKLDLINFWNSYNTAESKALNHFIKFNVKKSSKIKKQLIAFNSTCNYQKVYFVESLNQKNEIIERCLVYEKNNQYVKSNQFFVWCANHTNYFHHPIIEDLSEEEKLNRLNDLKITYNSIEDNFSVYFNSKIPENAEKEIDTFLYFTKKDKIDDSYGFPTVSDCQ